RMAVFNALNHTSCELRLREVRGTRTRRFRRSLRRPHRCAIAQPRAYLILNNLSRENAVHRIADEHVFCGIARLRLETELAIGNGLQRFDVTVDQKVPCPGIVGEEKAVRSVVSLPENGVIAAEG